MDFSPEVLVDFGFNLAGYVIVTLLIYLVVGRRSRRDKATESIGAENSIAERIEAQQNKIAPGDKSRMEFVAFNESPVQTFNKPASAKVPAQPAGQAHQVSRQENRREIYREARRLLARGKSGSELLGSLPLTEDEMEMLSFSRQA